MTTESDHIEVDEPSKMSESELFDSNELFDLFYKKLGLYNVEKETIVDYILEIKELLKTIQIEA